MSTEQLILNKIGNFVGLKIREVLDLLSFKADRAEVEALPRFHEAATRSEMLYLTGVRVNDFCLRGDNKAGYRLRALPASNIDNWEQVFASAAASVVKSVQFQEAVVRSSRMTWEDCPRPSPCWIPAAGSTSWTGSPST